MNKLSVKEICVWNGFNLFLVIYCYLLVSYIVGIRLPLDSFVGIFLFHQRLLYFGSTEKWFLWMYLSVVLRSIEWRKCTTCAQLLYIYLIVETGVKLAKELQKWCLFRVCMDSQIEGCYDYKFVAPVGRDLILIRWCGALYPDQLMPSAQPSLQTPTFHLWYSLWLQPKLTIKRTESKRIVFFSILSDATNESHLYLCESAVSPKTLVQPLIQLML